MAERPSALHTICIIALVLAVFALLGAAVDLSQSTGGSANPFQGMVGFGQPAEIQRLQEQMQAEVTAATLEWSTWFVWLAALNVVVVGLFASGGLLSLKLRPPGHILLMAGCGTALVADLVGIIPGYAVQKATLAAADRMMERLMGPFSDAGGMPEMAESFAHTAMVAGIVFGALMILAKLVFYIYGLAYLGRRSTRGLFAFK